MLPMFGRFVVKMIGIFNDEDVVQAGNEIHEVLIALQRAYPPCTSSWRCPPYFIGGAQFKRKFRSVDRFQEKRSAFGDASARRAIAGNSAAGQNPASAGAKYGTL